MKSTIIDYIIKKSYWYKDQFEDAERILKAPCELDVINFGSNPAKYGIDYSECGLKGHNFAVGPEAIHMDYIMLQKYHSYLRPDGPRLLLLLLFCPFNLCKDSYTERDGAVYKNLRYYRILDKDQIPNFDDELYERMVAHPSKGGFKSLYCALRQRHSGSRMQVDYNALTTEQMRQDAQRRINGWQGEFDLSDLNPNHLSPRVVQSIDYNSKLLDKINTFCKEKIINCFIIIPPLSKELSELIPSDFRERCFYSVIRKKNIPYFDYTDDIELTQNELFLDSLFLNKKGRLKFTNKLIFDIKNRSFNCE